MNTEIDSEVPTEEIDYLVLKMMTLRDRPLETALKCASLRHLR